MRGRKGWNQSELAEKVGTTQNQIYRLEKPSVTKPTISTLKKIAAALDVALVVRFVPFRQLVDWVSGTPFVDTGLSTEAFAVPSFEMEQSLAAQTGGKSVRQYFKDDAARASNFGIEGNLITLRNPAISGLDMAVSKRLKDIQRGTTSTGTGA